MDLGAYANIEDDVIEEIVKKNNIDVPRLRGYRLMKDEKPVTQEDLRLMCKDMEVDVLEGLICAVPYFSMNPDCYLSCKQTLKHKRYYIKNFWTNNAQVDWSRVHGWKRKRLKFAVKNFKRALKEQYDMFNKYAGREDILYIHSRIGGGNWPYYCDQVIHEPWFIEKVDDAYDSTYCDIYARIQYGR